MAWIQGQDGIWYMNCAWIHDDWTLKMEPIDGTLILDVRKRIGVRPALIKAGFVDPKIKVARGEPSYYGRVYYVTVNRPVPKPNNWNGHSTLYPGFGEVVIEYTLSVTEEQARGLWRGVLDRRMERFFGRLGAAKRATRRAFRLVGKCPDRQVARTSGSIMIDRKGELA